MKLTLGKLIKKYQLLSFFALSYLIMFGVVFTYIYLIPSTPVQRWSLVWFLSIFSPSISALIISWTIGGIPEIKRLLSGFNRWNVGFFWYFAAVFLILAPLVIALIYIALGHPFSGLTPGETIFTMSGTIVYNLFSGPIAEEMGWRGFALPRLQTKYNALVSSLILGVIWTCWHIPYFYVTGATQMSIPTSLLTGVLRLMPAMLFYMTAGPLLGLVVVAIIFITGPRYLSKKPAAELAL